MKPQHMPLKLGLRLSRRRLLGLGILGVAIAACSPGQSDRPSRSGLGIDQSSDQQLTITGSSTVAPLAAEIAKRFEAGHPGVRIDVQTGGSARGLSDVQRGLAEIGMVSRALKPSEINQFQSFTLAKDGVSLIVHRENAIAALSDAQIIEIYTGKMNTWDAVGGKAVPITVVHKAEGRSTLELFLAYFQLDNAQVKADVVIGDNQQGLKTVAGNPNAIGYVSIGAAEYDIQQGSPIRLLPIKGVVASTQTIQNGSFPLTRPLNLVTQTTPTGLAQEFIQFAQSTAVHDLILAQNFVPLDPTAIGSVAKPRS